MKGLPVDLGLTALLDVDGISISVTTKSHTAVNGDPFYIFDQNPEDFDLIVLRSKTHFRAFYEDAAETILIVDTPDYGPADLTTVPYQFLDTQAVFPFKKN
jgi:microcystin degradation protein MlrC